MEQCPKFIPLSNMNEHTLSHPSKCFNIKTKNSLETIMSDYEDDDWYLNFSYIKKVQYNPQ